MHVEDSGLHPFQNSTMLPTGCFHQLNRCLRDTADPWLKPVAFHSSTPQELGQSKSKFHGDPVAAFDSDVIEEEKRTLQ